MFSIRPVAFSAFVFCALCLPREEIRAADNAPHTGAPTAVAKEFTEDDATEAVKAVIAENTKDGVFRMKDSWTGTDLALFLDEVRLVRGMQGFGWFPNVVFHEQADPQKAIT